MQKSASIQPRTRHLIFIISAASRGSILTERLSPPRSIDQPTRSEETRRAAIGRAKTSTMSLLTKSSRWGSPPRTESGHRSTDKMVALRRTKRRGPQGKLFFEKSRLHFKKSFKSKPNGAQPENMAEAKPVSADAKAKETDYLGGLRKEEGRRGRFFEALKGTFDSRI